MLGEFDLLVPKQERNETWMEKDILMLDDKDKVIDVYNKLSADDSEVQCQLDFGSGGGEEKYIRREQAWGAKMEDLDMKLLEACKFGCADWSYKHHTREAPLFQDMTHRLYVNRRYYKAVADYLNEKEEARSLDSALPNDPNTNSTMSKDERSIVTPLDSLAQVGSKVALSFAFTFLKRAWRTSEDSELCTDLLQDTLAAFRALPPASMYDTSQMSTTWLDVVERSKEFLKSVACGDLSGSREPDALAAGGNASIPILDQHLAINLLLEIAFQKGNIRNLLEILLYVLNMWDTRKQHPDSRKNYQRTSAPLLHFLKRMKGLKLESILNAQELDLALLERAARKQEIDDEMPDPNDILLSTLTFPDREDLCIDFQQAVVVTLSCLNRLVQPLLYANATSALETGKNNIFKRKFSGPACSKVFLWGFTGVTYPCPELSGIKFSQVECGGLFNTALSDNGTLYVFGRFQDWSASGILQCRSDLHFTVKKFESPDSKFVKIAMHPKESYLLALTENGQAYMCGRMVHFGKDFLAKPEKMEKNMPWKKMGKVIDIACGFDYIAVVAQSGKVYTWNKKNRDKPNQPQLLEDFKKYVIKQFSAGKSDKSAAMLSAENEIITFTVQAGGVLAAEESMFLDYDQKRRIRRLQRIYSGDNFTAAITKEGELYVWGPGVKGLVSTACVNNQQDNQDDSPATLVKTPGKVEDISCDCYALYVVTENGEVLHWRKGTLDGLQPLRTFGDKKISGVCMGSRFNAAWGIDECAKSNLPESLPFVLQPNEETMCLLDNFLNKLCANWDMTWPPSQERECMAVATLNLLRLHFQESVFRDEKSDQQCTSQNSDRPLLDCTQQWPCIANLKKNIIFLASTPGIISSIQLSAQNCLNAGWRILLPSATERANALADVLENSRETSKPHTAQTFLVGLLLESLLVGEGMENLVAIATSKVGICVERRPTDSVEEKSDLSEDGESESVSVEPSLPKENNTMKLVELILKKLCRRTIQYLKKNLSLEKLENTTENQQVLEFLQKFQTIVTAYALDTKNKMMPGCANLLKEYTALICDHVMAILKEAQSILGDVKNEKVDSKDENASRFYHTSQCIATDAGCTLLSPLIASLFLTQIEHGEENLVFCDAVDLGFIANFEPIKHLTQLLTALDQYNHFAPCCLDEEEYALSWSRTRYHCKIPDPFEDLEEDLMVIREEDLENHNLDGGHWVVIDGKVYDTEKRVDIEPGSSKSLTGHPEISHMLVGKYLPPEKDVAVSPLSFHKDSKISDFAIAARTLAVFISTHLAGFQKHKFAREKLKDVTENVRLLLKNGLESDEKNEAVNLDIPAIGHRNLFLNKDSAHPATKQFLLSLVNFEHFGGHGLKLPDESDIEKHAVHHFLHKFDHICKKFGHFSHGQNDSKSALDQFGRFYIACLLKHHDLADAALTCSEQKHARLPHSISELCNTVGKAKLKLIQEHQSSGTSYPEICGPLIDRLWFLLTEVAPPMSPLVEARLKNIWQPKSRWKRALELWKKQKEKNAMKEKQRQSSVPDKTGDGQPSKVKKVQKYSEKKCKKDADVNHNYWGLIYDVVSSKADFKMLEQHMNGPGLLDEKITLAVTDFAFNKGLDTNALRDLMVYCRHSISNSMGALHEIVDIFNEKFIVPSTTYCLRTSWNGLFDDVDDGIAAKAIEKSIRKEEERKKKDDERTNDRNYYRYPRREYTKMEKRIMNYPTIPCDPFLDLKHKLARNKFKTWTIEKFRNVSMDLLNMIKNHKKHQSDAPSSPTTTAMKTALLDKQFLISKIRDLLMETHSLHFGWCDEDANRTQSVLSGCQALFEKLLITLMEDEKDPDDSQKKDEEPDIASGGRRGGSAKSSATIPHPELETGAKLVAAMTFGTNVVRGRDWKWQEQDGNPPGEGEVIGSAEDGWVRVRWPSGITNSYRMGKDDKYDVKLAHPERFCADDEVGHSECGKMVPRSRYTSSTQRSSDPLFPMVMMKRACSGNIEIQCLSLARLKPLNKGAARIISKRIFNVLKPENNHELRNKDDWHSFEFIRALVTINRELSPFFVTPEWINLLQGSIGHDYCTVMEGNVRQQIQALRLLGVLLLSIQDENELDNRSSYAKHLFKTLGLLAIGLKLQDPLDYASKNAFLKRNPSLTGISQCADHAGTIAEEIVELLRKLHADCGWRDLIGQSICDHLQSVPSFMFLETKNIQEIDEENLSLAFGALAVICRVDKRIRIGGNIEHIETDSPSTGIFAKPEARGKGVMTGTGEKREIAGFYIRPNGNHEIFEGELEDIRPCPPTYKFDWEGLPWSTSVTTTCSELMKIVLSPASMFFSGLGMMERPNNASGAKPKTTAVLDYNPDHSCEEKIQLCKFHLYLYLLRSLPILLQNQTVLRSVLKFLPVTSEETPTKIETKNIEKEETQPEIQLSSSCPNFPIKNQDSHLRKTASDGSLDSEENFLARPLLPMPEIVPETKGVEVPDSKPDDSPDSNDVTEATEEYRSESEMDESSENLKDSFADESNDREMKQKNMLQDLLSLSKHPSRLKPHFKTSEMEEAVSLLLVFIESSMDQQDILNDYFNKLKIPYSVMEAAGIDPEGGGKLDIMLRQAKRTLNEKREKENEHARQLQIYKDAWLVLKGNPRSGETDSNRSSTTPSAPRWSPFPADPHSRSLKAQAAQGVEIPSENLERLKDMGFTNRHIITAYRELSRRPLLASQRAVVQGGFLPDMELVVAWLLENPPATVEDSLSEDDDDIDGFTIIENDIFGHNQHLLPEEVFHGLDEPGDSSSSDSDSSDDDFAGASSSPNHTPRENTSAFDNAASGSSYRAPSDFASSNEYALYVRENIKVGMMVKCCYSYEDVKEGDTGRVLKLDHDGLNDLNVHAAWASKGGTYWVRYVHVQLIRDDSRPLTQDETEQLLSPIDVGDRVRVRTSVTTPKYKWGSVSHGSVGRVMNISGKDAVVNFEEQQHWTGLLSELEKVPIPHPGVTCDQCQTTPITGPRYKCTICYDYDMCGNCFGKKRHASPRHVFDMIEKPGASRVRTTASIPPTAVRQRTLSAMHTDVAFSPADTSEYNRRSSKSAERAIPGHEDSTDTGVSRKTSRGKNPKETMTWGKLVESLEASSGNDTVHCLLDGSDETFWKSTGNVGEHKLVLNMKPGAVVTSLIMQVDPHDSSYMPSLVKIVLSGTDCKKLKSRAIRIQPSAKHVLLLRDCDKHFNQITINIQKCKSFGIDCKIHSLFIKGYLLPTKRTSSVRGKINLAQRDTLKSDEEKIQQLFLASDSEDEIEPNFRQRVKSKDKKRGARGPMNTKVFVWGLNDKDQLGGPKGSKITAPMFSETLSSLKVSQVVGGSKSLYIITQEGKIFACGESTSGRLGLGLVSSNISTPTFVSHLSSYFIRKVAVHSGGRHAMALSSTGIVFSWGDGEDGKLGHSNRADCHKPRLIEALKGQHIVDIACGSAHSAAVTVTGKLFTWGQGNYGRLGHGDNNTQLKPKMVASLQGVHVAKVACGSRDAQTLCLSRDEKVYSWGDGDFGKLGRGGSEGCSTPQVIDKLTGKGIIKIDCGAQFSLALSKNGEIWTWGKGDYFRLGQGHDGHVRHPTIIPELKDKKIVKVAVGALHCLAVTDTGQVYSWGDNDHGQQGNCTTTVNRKPSPVEHLGRFKITNVACGSSHSIAWSITDETRESHFEPLRFPVMKDCLGESYASKAHGDKEGPRKRNLLDLAGGYYRSKEEKEKKENSEENKTKPSLTKMVVAIHSMEGKKAALKTLVQSLQIHFARDLVTRSLLPAKYTKDDENVSSSESKIPLCGETTSQSLGLVNNGLENSSTVGKSEIAGEPSSFLEQQFDNEPGPSTSQTSHPKLKPSDHAMASLIAETITSTEEITLPTPKKLNDSEIDEETTESTGLKVNGAIRKVSDVEIWSELGYQDTKHLAELLKLAVASRLPIENFVAISHGLNHLVKSHLKVTKLLLSQCLCELEEVTGKAESKSFEMRPVTQESTHPYADDCEISGNVKIPGAKSLRIEFDSQCSTETRHDVLTLYTQGRKTLVAQLSGREQSDWSKLINIEGDELNWTFKSDASVNGWGWKFTAYPICSIGQSNKEDLTKMSDCHILSKPLIAFASHLLEIVLPQQQQSSLPSKDAIVELLDSKSSIFQQLITTLASCVQTSLIGPEMRIWAIQQLQNLCFHLVKLRLEREEIQKLFRPIISILPDVLCVQFKYEEPYIRLGKQLMHSAYLRELLTLASDLDLESVTEREAKQKLAPFSAYFLTKKTLDSLIARQAFPVYFLQRVSLKLDDVIGDDFDDVQAFMPAHEDNSLFTQEMDEQLVNWMNSSPGDWTQSWGGSGQIFGWGHNHRGQLGGIDGAKVKVPALCSTLVSLQPIALAGGEQTLYAITSDGKVYATGYGASGRLGIGSSDSIALPTLLESIRHVHITKVSVNSGGKHILALSVDGEVYSWGEGGDGKLGHGTRTSCDRPRVIESLRGVDIIDISAGGAHSAAISHTGRLYTWGKGRYGRLGHSDSEDRLKPKAVEALDPYHVRCVACGSGDAQTLCVTDSARRESGIENDATLVWSWGDGDYGKLGRGGSEMSKVPMQIDTLTKKHIITVKCGSQFSLALSKSGAVYTWGKGDYYRLGHGSDQHVRYPKIVEDLRGKKVIDVSTGSLHCIVCTEDGEVYAWGDNDEGQIGDATTQPAKRLTLIKTLSDQGVDRVACGSAHSIAWSTGSMRSRRKGSQPRLPTSVPLKYSLLQAIPIAILRNRLVLLNQFSEIFCSCIPLLSLLDKSWRGSPCSAISSDLLSNFESLSPTPRFPDIVRGLLINSGKECFFRKVVQTTMVRDKQHGPVIELNRIEVKEIKKTGVPLTGMDFLKAVFPQACCSIDRLLPDSVLLPHRVWKVKFVGESVDDCGGGYSESIAEMCDELENGSVPLLTQTPNGRDEAGANRDCFLLLPPVVDPTVRFSLTTTIYRMFKFLGILIGSAIRTGSPLSLTLAEPVWKMLSGQEQCLTDISEVDKDFLPKLMFIRDAEADDLDSMNLPFTILSASGREVALSKLHSTVNVCNRNEYIRQAIQFRLHEFEHIVNFVRDGIACVVPLPLISLFTAHELETMVCGSPDIPLSLLKSVASFKDPSSNDDLQTWFWEIMESMTNEEKSLFLRFVWGRTRLPRTIADFRGRDFVIQVLDKYHPPDYYLPESYTCFFLLKLPRYSSKAIMDEKLKYAIYFCKSIDTDDYARMAMNGEDDDEDLEDLITNNNNALDALTAATGVRSMRTRVARLRTQVRTTHLNLLSRYSSNVSRYLQRRPPSLGLGSSLLFDVDSNPDDDSSTSGPDSNSDSDSDSVIVF